MNHLRFLACKRENNNLYNFKQAHKISASKPRGIIVTNIDNQNLTKKLFPDTLQEMMTMTMATTKMMKMMKISTRAV